MRFARVLYSSVMAGMVMAIGYISSIAVLNESKFAGAILFSIGLIAVLSMDLHLFTTRSGAIYDDSRRLDKKVGALILTLIGNIIGAAAIGFVTHNMHLEEAKEIMRAKNEHDVLSVFVSAIICGMLIYIAYRCYRRAEGNISGIATVILVSAAISICNFEYGIANVTFFSKTFVFVPFAFVYMGFSLLGNFVGALALSTLYELKKAAEAERKRHHRHHHKHHSSHSKTENTEAPSSEK